MTPEQEKQWREELIHLIERKNKSEKSCSGCKFLEHIDGYNGESLGWNCTVTGNPEYIYHDKDGCEKRIPDEVYIDEEFEMIYFSARKKAQEEIDRLSNRNSQLEDFCNEFVYGEENPEYYSTMTDKLKERDKEIAQLKEELKRERSAVDFYANKIHWEKFTEAYSEYDYESRVLCAVDCIIEYDVETFEGKVFADRDHSVGGKLARQTQQQRRIEL